MDHRKGLLPGKTLAFPGLDCVIEEEIGRGSNAIVYKGWYADQQQSEWKHEVLIKELFPLHPKGAILRETDGSITCLPEGEPLWEQHRTSFMAGNEAHLTLLKLHPDEVGANLNTYELNHTFYTILGFTGGRNLSAELRGPVPVLRQAAERMMKLLDAAEAFHASGMLHLDIAPDNILLTGQGRRERLMLIDYNSCVTKADLQQGKPVSISIKPGYTAPEIRSGRVRDAGEASDLYSITAVFFHMLTGNKLTPIQTVCAVCPDVSGCPCLKDMPEPVKIWTARILRRGLQTLPGRRYQQTAAFRTDLEELLDRIDGIGVTHWALAEAGRRRIEQTLRINPSLAFVLEDEEVLPSYVQTEEGQLPAEHEIARMTTAEGQHTLLLAAGGLGKTTALLRGAWTLSAHYAPDQPAVIYLPAYGWRAGEENLVLNRILETLRFRTETGGFAEARQMLTNLLEKPLPGPGGSKPVLLLMLDGLNEVSGDTRLLLEEIQQLQNLPGLRILATSRTDEGTLPFRRIHLAELREEDVQHALRRAGLLMPEAEDIRHLLRTPLMLSIFIQTARMEEKQLTIRTRNELLDAYFSALRMKAAGPEAENGDARWRIDAALSLVLPALAQEMSRSGGGLGDAALLPATEQCWRLLGTRPLLKAYPEWTGRSAAIRGNAETAEEWYGLMVHDLLWKQLGLLIRDDQGRYQISHQVIAEYMLDLARKNHQEIFRRKRMALAMRTALGLLIAGAAAMLILRLTAPRPYNEELADTVFQKAVSAYLTAGLQCENMDKLISSAGDTTEAFSQQALRFEQRNAAGVSSPEEALELLKTMMQSGSVMPWSGRPMDEDACASLLALPEERSASYLRFAEQLALLMTANPQNETFLAQYRETLSELTAKDARIAACLYLLACEPHLTGPYAEDPTHKGETDVSFLIPAQESARTEAQDKTADALQTDLEQLTKERDTLLESLTNTTPE